MTSKCKSLIVCKLHVSEAQFFRGHSIQWQPDVIAGKISRSILIVVKGNIVMLLRSHISKRKKCIPHCKIRKCYKASEYYLIGRIKILAYFFRILPHFLLISLLKEKTRVLTNCRIYRPQHLQGLLFPRGKYDRSVILFSRS